MLLNIKKYYFLIVFTISSMIIVSAYILEYIYNFPPCKLCIYQRIPYFLILFVCATSFLMEYRNIHFYAIFFLFFSSFLIASFHSLVERGLIEYNSGCSSSINDFESIEDLRNHLESVALTKCDEIIFSIMGLSLANINSLISFSLVLFNIYFILRLYGSKN